MSALAIAPLLFAGCASTPAEKSLSRFRFEEEHMGTLWTITLYAPDKVMAESGAKAAFARVAQLDARFTDYAPDSELSMLRYAEPGKPVRISTNLFDIFQRSLEISRRTEGAFDMTVGPFVHLWRTARKAKILPEQIELVEAARAVGWQ
ncbi:MAG: FAD:protein FMN transferase, partial [Verrucomicrobia bacterium]|nr:FAD:protein FMN transferase [Verrucomicrobiota bacterium]